MGCYNTILARCPRCGEENEFQTKGGDCSLSSFTIDEAPGADMLDSNRHAPRPCIKCGVELWFEYTVEKIHVTNRRLVAGGDQPPNAGRILAANDLSKDR